MVSNKKRMIKDIFGDDEDDIEQSQNGGRDNKGRHNVDGKTDTSERQKGSDSKKLHAQGDAPAPDRPKKKKKLEKKAKPVDGAEVIGHDPEITVEQKLLHLERDFELAIKSVQSTRTKRKKNGEDIVSDQHL
ncbi:hypothetical protein BGX24_006259 [Mortierella sp. AD032]|nr:hypothetical protein BGX24_006259 [Mortierella sp. AD032]